MKTEVRLTVAAIAATLPLLSASAAQTINFGPAPLGPPDGLIADGYAGFDWHGATNDERLDASYHSTCGAGGCTGDGYTSAWITEMSRPAAFDLLSMSTQSLFADLPCCNSVVTFETVISGYYNGNLVKTLTEEGQNWGENDLTINMDGVNDIKFSTTSTFETYYGPGIAPSFITYPDITLVTQMKVDNVAGAAKAPELNPTTTASALTLLLGSLLVIRGRPARRSYEY